MVRSRDKEDREAGWFGVGERALCSWCGQDRFGVEQDGEECKENRGGVAHRREAEGREQVEEAWEDPDADKFGRCLCLRGGERLRRGQGCHA